MRREIVGEKVEIANGVDQFVLTGFEDKLQAVLDESKRRFLNYFFTNPDGPVTAIKGETPPVLAAALITRFSRSEEPDITEIFWQEFVKKDELGIGIYLADMTQSPSATEVLSTEKAREMIKRVTDRFGDDSVREQASGYVVVNNSSVLSSMEVFREPLVTGIEASTRYIDFGEKDYTGQYRYVTPENIENSEHADKYHQAMDQLFETYQGLWQPVWDYVVENNPKPEGMSELAYATAVKGRVCDNLRKLLPLGVKTNYGLHAKYRTFTEIIMNQRASQLPESVNIANQIATELIKVNPEFVSVVNAEHSPAWTEYMKFVRSTASEFSTTENHFRIGQASDVEVNILNNEPLVDLVVAVLSSTHSSARHPDLVLAAKEKIARGEHLQLLKAYGEARKNRRHKVPEELENIIVRIGLHGLSFGSAKDYNRHRKLMHKADLDWSGQLDCYVPEDINSIGGETKERYLRAQEIAQEAFMAVKEHFPVEARNLLTHGTRTSMVLTMGLGEAIWIAELRSIASGDPEYRIFAQMLYESLCEAIPGVEHIATYVDMDNYDLGRIKEAVRADLKGAL